MGNGTFGDDRGLRLAVMAVPKQQLGGVTLNELCCEGKSRVYSDCVDSTVCNFS